MDFHVLFNKLRKKNDLITVKNHEGEYLIMGGIKSIWKKNSIINLDTVIFTISCDEVKSKKLINEFLKVENELNKNILNKILNVYFLVENNIEIKFNKNYSKERKYCLLELKNCFIVIYFYERTISGYNMSFIDKYVISKKTGEVIISKYLSNELIDFVNESAILFDKYIRNLPEYRIKFLLENKKIIISEDPDFKKHSFLKNQFKMKGWFHLWTY